MTKKDDQRGSGRILKNAAKEQSKQDKQAAQIAAQREAARIARLRAEDDAAAERRRQERNK